MNFVPVDLYMGKLFWIGGYPVLRDVVTCGEKSARIDGEYPY
jgi:hypothetical protein